MKKIAGLMFAVVLLGCAAATDAGSGLNRLDKEPNNCDFLYTMNSSATTYSLSGAYDYLENLILEQEKTGDSYYIVNQNVIENEDAVFGPKNTFKFKVKVYNCEK